MRVRCARACVERGSALSHANIHCVGVPKTGRDLGAKTHKGLSWWQDSGADESLTGAVKADGELRWSHLLKTALIPSLKDSKSVSCVDLMSLMSLGVSANSRTYFQAFQESTT